VEKEVIDPENARLEIQIGSQARASRVEISNCVANQEVGIKVDAKREMAVERDVEVVVVLEAVAVPITTRTEVSAYGQSSQETTYRGSARSNQKEEK
jgi:hypothetical protein